MAWDTIDLTSQCRQQVGEVEEDDALISLALRRVHCDMDDSSDSRLLWRARVEKSVRAGSLLRLVRQLAPLGEEEDTVSAYRTCFLTTYRTFATAGDVLDNITEWYLALSPTTGSLPAEADSKINTRRSILTFLRLWFDRYPSDWTPPLISQLKQFLKQQEHCSSEISDLLQYTKNFTPSISSSSPSDESKVELVEVSKFTLYSLYPVQFAQALTATDAALFRAVKPHQCLHYVRHQQKKAATVQSCIDQFNRLSLIVISTILQPSLTQSDANNRGRAIAQWISVAHQCRLLKNFSSLRAIVSSLESSAIFRLGRSWAAVPNDQMLLFRELQQLVSHEHNHQASRDVLNKEGTGKHVLQISPRKGKNPRVPTEVIHGVVPYLGTFLTDLTMLHTAYPDYVKGELINFEKRRMEFEVLAKLSLFQTAASNYSFTPQPVFEQWMDNTCVMSETESYELSKALEEDSLSKPDEKSDSSKQCQAILMKTLQVITRAKGRSSSRSSSPSPSEGTPDSDGKELPLVDDESFIVRVSLSTSDLHMYKTVKLSKADRTNAVVKVLLDKLDLTNSLSSFILQQITPNGNMTIPEGATVYYALATDPGTVPQLRLQPKDRHSS